VAYDLSSLTGRSVLVTGHTGFKGSWLALWLHQLGAHVTGYALDPLGKPNHFDAADIGPLLIDDIRADIRDADRLAEALRRVEPEVIFHLAAQPIVRASLLEPRHTFDVIVMGTASLLDAVRLAGRPCVVLCSRQHQPGTTRCRPAGPTGRVLQQRGCRDECRHHP